VDKALFPGRHRPHVDPDQALYQRICAAASASHTVSMGRRSRWRGLACDPVPRITQFAGACRACRAGGQVHAGRGAQAISAAFSPAEAPERRILSPLTDVALVAGLTGLTRTGGPRRSALGYPTQSTQAAATEFMAGIPGRPRG